MKKLITIILTLAIFLIPQLGQAAIALDTSTYYLSAGAATSHTKAYTMGVVSNGLLVVGVSCTGVADPVTGVTYAGTAMSQSKKLTYSTTYNSYIYTLANPASGSNNIVVSLSSSRNCYMSIASYSGASQTGIPDASTSGSNTSGTSLTGTLTTVADNSWTHIFMRNEQGAFTPSAGTTLRGDTGAYGISAGDSNGAITPAGSTSLGGSWTGNAIWGYVMISFAPAGGAPPVSTNVPKNQNLIIFE